MKVIRDRLELCSASERGMTLIEVMVAMFIFGLVSLGLIYTMVSVLSVTRDSRVRQVAANLAAQEVDLARDIEDVANYGGGVRDITLNGDTFTVTRTSSWVTNSATSGPNCGTTGGTLRYKQIHVEVTWGGMRGDTGVVSDTLINPNERVSHPDFGTLMVTVANSVPTGFAGVTVTARLQNTSTVVTTGVTDSNGCAYLLMVPPGYYDLTIEGPSHEQFITLGSGAAPLEVTSSVAGEVSAVLFEVDLAATFNVSYTHDGTAVASDLLPTNMKTSLLSTAGTLVSDRSANTAFPRVSVVPLANTTVIAGDSVSCVASDPQVWPETTTQFQGERQPGVAAESGQVVNISVPVRLVEIINRNNSYITALSQNVGPACATQQKYTFTRMTSNSQYIALPYGNWKLYSGSSSGSTSTNLGSSSNTYYAVTGNDRIGSSATQKTITLEPRVSK